MTNFVSGPRTTLRVEQREVGERREVVRGHEEGGRRGKVGERRTMLQKLSKCEVKA